MKKLFAVIAIWLFAIPFANYFNSTLKLPQDYTTWLLCSAILHPITFILDQAQQHAFELITTLFILVIAALAELSFSKMFKA